MLQVILPRATKGTPCNSPGTICTGLYSISTSTFSEKKRLSEIPEETQPPTL